jgi:ATP-binding cassette, subfamily F, member 3
MSLLNAVDLGKSYGPEDIFDHISFSIPHRARIGLVGANGIGKTTLLRILMGLEEASSGKVTHARNLRIGYLPQNATIDSTSTLWDECLHAFQNLVERREELTRLESAMSTAEEPQEIIASYGRLQDEFDKLGGYTFENRIQQTLSGLSFTLEDYYRPLKQLSGGQRTRAFLARLLLSDPDLLLLDEPTNHLDIAAIEWLETYLKEWHGATLIVSHDRYFLNAVATAIWEMTPIMEIYHGNYSAYMLQREERYQRRLEEYKTQQEFIEKEEDFIRRNIAGQNTRQAQGRRERLERLLKEARLTPPMKSKNLRFHLLPASRSGELVLRTYGLSVGYMDEGKALFHVPDLTLRRNECAALIGPNGAGKTTFLRTILEHIPPLEGETLLGSSLKIGYFAQAHEDLHLEWTLMEEISAAAPGMLPAGIRDYLARFLFSGDDVFKPVKILSGGERGRLALACLALKGSNLLLLDEPTNHLDLPSQEILQAILAEFGGTILLVSHDRYLIDALATQVWEIIPDESALNVFEGTYSEYRAASLAAAEAASVPVPEQKKVPAAQPKVAGGVSKFELRKRQEKLRGLEQRIAALETQLAVVIRQLENPPTDYAKLQRLAEDYKQIRKMLDLHLEDWAKVAESVENGVEGTD